MHKTASKALGFIVAISCFLTLFSPAPLKVPANSVEEIHAETIEEISEDEDFPSEEENAEEVIESADSQLDDSENSRAENVETEAGKVRNLLLTSALTDAVVRQKDGKDWVPVSEEEDYTYGLDPDLAEVQMELTFRKTEEAKWNTADEFWFCLPDLKHFSYQPDAGNILNMDGEETGTYVFSNEGPSAHQENSDFQESDEPDITAEREIWLQLSLDDRQKFCEEGNFVLLLTLDLKNKHFISEEVEFSSEEGYQSLCLKNSSRNDEDSVIFGTVSEITAEIKSGSDAAAKVAPLRRVANALQNVEETNPQNEDTSSEIASYADTSIPRLNDYIVNSSDQPFTFQYTGSDNKIYTVTPNADNNYIIPDGAKDISIVANFEFGPNTLVNGNNKLIYYFPPGVIPLEEPLTGTINLPGSSKTLGTYSVSKDGYMILEFIPEIVEQNKTAAVEGGLKIQGSLEGIAKDTKTEIEIGNSSTLNLVYAPDTQLEMNKTSTNNNIVKNDNNENTIDSKTISYQTTIHSPKATKGTFTIKDTHQGPLNIDTNTVKVISSKRGEIKLGPDGNPVSAAVNPYYTNELIISNLPPMMADETYTLIYTAHIPEDQYFDADISNTVKVQTTSEYGETIDQNSNNFKVKYVGGTKLDKTGKVNEAGLFEWKITIDSQKVDLHGWQLTDIFWKGDDREHSQPYTGPATIKIYKEGETNPTEISVTDLSKYSFPQNTKGLIEITYTTGEALGNPDNKESNKVTLKKDDNHYLEKEAYVDPKNPLSKGSNPGSTQILEGSGDVRLSWNIGINNDSNNSCAMTAPWTITDQISDGKSYFGKEEIEELIANINNNQTKLGVFTLELFTKADDKNPVTTLKSDASEKINALTGKYQKLKITFSKSLAKNEKLNFNYHTRVDHDTFGFGISFTNEVMLNDVCVKDATNTPPEPPEPKPAITFKKYDAKDSGFGAISQDVPKAETDHKLKDITASDESEVSWLLHTVFNENWTGEDIWIEDVIPNGLSLNTAKTKMRVGYWPGEFPIQWENDKEGKVIPNSTAPELQSVILSYGINIKVLPGLNDTQGERISIHIPKEVVKYISGMGGNSFIDFLLPCKIENFNNSEIWTFDEDKEISIATFANKAYVKENNKDVLTETSQTQKVEKSETILTKP